MDIVKRLSSENAGRAMKKHMANYEKNRDKTNLT